MSIDIYVFLDSCNAVRRVSGLVDVELIELIALFNRFC
jgi:hypothetical protein